MASSRCQFFKPVLMRAGRMIGAADETTAINASSSKMESFVPSSLSASTFGA